MITVDSLTKRYGKKTVVNDLSFAVQPGRVTGFLGPNGAGKTTTLRMLLGLIRSDAGIALIDGKRYDGLRHPSAHVGAVLEDAGFHPGRTARNHLRVLAAAGRHPDSRVAEVLDEVGIAYAADQRVKGFSMGMRQRLGIASALLGRPDVLILDEPVNGLDPPGIRWIRDLMRGAAAQGQTVLVSSHLLSEVAQTVDDLVVIANGVLVASGPLEQVLAGVDSQPATRVRAADSGRLAAALRERGIAVESDGSDALIAHGAPPADVGAVAADHGLALVELGPVSRSLEDAFFELTGSQT